MLAGRSGVATRTISDLERGIIAAPRLTTARMLADGLGLAGAQRTQFVAAARGSAEPTLAVFRRVLVPPTALIGREAAAASLGALLASPSVRLVTLTGPGGVGKTRLAAEAAAGAVPAVVNEVVDVDLSNARDDSGLLRETARALGHEDKAGGPDDLAELIGERSMLLVLDNFEQLVVAAPLVSRVLSRCPRLKVLVTSRIPLRIRGENDVPVPPLAVPDTTATLAQITTSPSARMFAECARERRMNWRLDTATASHVAVICRAVDGIPLAVELAASYIGTLDVAEIAQRLTESMGSSRLLVSGPRDLPARQRTIVATVAWSYDLLSPAARVLLRRLAVFPAGFTADAAEEVCGGTADLPGSAVLDGLTAIVDAGLVRMLVQPSAVRYQPYQTVHEYARERLEESGEAAEMAAVHVRHVLRLAESLADALNGPEQATWLSRLDPHREDIRFAVERSLDAGEQLQALRISTAAWRFWYGRGHIQEGYELLARALGDAVPANLNAQDSRIWARALNGAASLHYVLGGRDEVRARYARAAALSERAGDSNGVSAALSNLGMYEHYSGDRARAPGIYRQALAAARLTDDDQITAAILQNLGTLLIQNGDHDAAAPVLDEALARFRDCGMVRSEADVQGSRAELALARHDFAEARKIAKTVQGLFEELHDDRGLRQTDLLFANIALASGDASHAYQLYESSAKGHRDLGDLWGQTEGLLGQARAALQLGRLAKARSLAREARTLAARIGDPGSTRTADQIIEGAS